MFNLPWLKFEGANFQCWDARTKIGRYFVQYDANVRDCILKFEDYELPLTVGDVFSADGIRMRAEADYLSRISEFVPVLKPGQVGIPLELLQSISEALFGFAADLVLDRKMETSRRVYKLFETLKSYMPQPDVKPAQNVCTDCKGSGVLVKGYHDGHSGFTYDMTCLTCNGTGIVAEPVQGLDTVAESVDKVGGKTE